MAEPGNKERKNTTMYRGLVEALKCSRITNFATSQQYFFSGRIHSRLPIGWIGLKPYFE